VNSEKYVCKDCGKIISIKKRRRHKNRGYPRGPVLVSEGRHDPRARGRSPYPYSRLRSQSKYG